MSTVCPSSAGCFHLDNTQFKLRVHKNEFTALKQPPQSLDFNPLTTNRRFNHKHNLDVNMDQNVSLMLMFEVQPSTSNKLFNPFFGEGGHMLPEVT